MLLHSITLVTYSTHFLALLYFIQRSCSVPVLIHLVLVFVGRKETDHTSWYDGAQVDHGATQFIQLIIIINYNNW